MNFFFFVRNSHNVIIYFFFIMSYSPLFLSSNCYRHVCLCEPSTVALGEIAYFRNAKWQWTGGTLCYLLYSRYTLQPCECSNKSSVVRSLSKFWQYFIMYMASKCNWSNCFLRLTITLTCKLINDVNANK